MHTIHEAAEAIKQKQITPIDLVEQCLANIDRWEEKVRAWVFVDRDGARATAKRLTDELARGQYRGPLHGIPIGVKDIFDVFDWPTAAGSKLWTNSIARQDADVVRQLRQAGAIFLGKTVTTQWASFDPPVTRNPWNLAHTPGGSSSGSAAAVATGMCLGALGSQTGGSITRPASYCGVAGCKPSYGLVSCNGVVPLAPCMDHPGPIARCAHDLAIMLQNMVTAYHAIKGHQRYGDSDYTEMFRDAGKYAGFEFRRFRGFFHERAEPAVREAMDAACKTIEAKSGWSIRSEALPASFSEVVPRHRTMMAVGAAAYHGKRLAKHPEDYLPRIRALIEEGLACKATELHDCHSHQIQLREELDKMMRAAGGVFLTPATTSPAPDSTTTGDPAFNSPWSYTGLPTLSVPTGQFIHGLPLAIQLIASEGLEGQLFMAAAWVEAALNAGPLTPSLPR
jgi:aspartyl-tRNA(Asn)/glutamyl-tRNA(Gln) amidotransferase subunit A